MTYDPHRHLADTATTKPLTVRVLPGRLSDLSVFQSKLGLYSAFAWARTALNGPKRPGFRAGQREEREFSRLLERKGNQAVTGYTAKQVPSHGR